MADKEGDLSKELSKTAHKVTRYGDDFAVKPLQGWVMKEPKDASEPHWEKRWLVLEKDVADRPVLVYYSDDLKHTIKGKIMVSDIKDVRQNATGKAFCFGLVTESRVYWFQTDSEINYSKWTISIKANSALKMS